jgi:hypothetical protein
MVSRVLIMGKCIRSSWSVNHKTLLLRADQELERPSATLLDHRHRGQSRKMARTPRAKTVAGLRSNLVVGHQLHQKSGMVQVGLKSSLHFFTLLEAEVDAETRKIRSESLLLRTKSQFWWLS